MEDILRSEHETRKFRLLALLLVAAGVYTRQYQVNVLWQAVALASLYLIYLTVLLFSLIRHISPKLLPYVMLVIDTAFVSGTLHVFGVDSTFFVLLPVLILYYAIFFGYASSFACATLVAFCYIGLAYLQQADAMLGRVLPVQIPLFYLIALFAGYLSQQRHRAQRERQELSILLQAERGARAMLDLTSGLASVLDSDAIATHSLQLLSKAAGCTLASIRLLEESGRPGQALQFLGSGVKIAQVDTAATAPEREAAETGAFVEIVEPKAELVPGWVAAQRLGYMVVVPLLDAERVIGVVSLGSVNAHQRLNDEQRDMVNALAHFFAPLISHAQEYASAQKQGARLRSELRGTVQRIVHTQQRQKRGDAHVGRLIVEPARQRAAIGDVTLNLSRRELDVLALLARHPDEAVNQEALLREIWGDGEHRSNVVDVAITRLRRKLAQQASAGDLIETIRGTGYMLNSRAVAQVKTAASEPNGSRRLGQKGAMLLETVISLAVVAMVVPALLAALSAVIIHAFEYGDRTQLLELGQNQIESVKQQSFQASPANYSLISAVPQDYSVSLATAEAQRYVYANGTAAPEVLQVITATVTGYNGILTMTAYRYRE